MAFIGIRLWVESRDGFRKLQDGRELDGSKRRAVRSEPRRVVPARRARSFAGRHRRECVVSSRDGVEHVAPGRKTRDFRNRGDSRAATRRELPHPVLAVAPSVAELVSELSLRPGSPRVNTSTFGHRDRVPASRGHLEHVFIAEERAIDDRRCQDISGRPASGGSDAAPSPREDRAGCRNREGMVAPTRDVFASNSGMFQRPYQRRFRAIFDVAVTQGTVFPPSPGVHPPRRAQRDAVVITRADLRHSHAPQSVHHARYVAIESVTVSERAERAAAERDDASVGSQRERVTGAARHRRESHIRARDGCTDARMHSPRHRRRVRSSSREASGITLIPR